MNRRTLFALRGSIRKWQGIVAGTEVDKGAANCPLCLLFNRQGGCGKCPVKEKTGRNWCDGTPFNEWEDENPGFDRRANTPQLKRIARKELNFLKSLLPKNGAK